LKPSYNNVDLGEVELVVDDTHGSYSRELPRYNFSVLYEMRKEIIDQKAGLARMTVRVPMDNMRRVTVREQDYFYHSITNTPFSLGISLPSKYGKYRVIGGMHLAQKDSFDATEILSGDKWSLHPDWIYCKYHDNHKQFCSQEDSIKHFLELMGAQDNFNWGKKSTELTECKNYDRWNFPDHCKNQESRKSPYYCK